MTTFEKVLGRLISRSRKRQNLTSRALEKSLELKVGTLSKIEKGLGKASPSSVRKVLLELNVSPAQVRAEYLKAGRDYLERVYRSTREHSRKSAKK